MRSNDLTPLLNPEKSQALGYRQGVIVAYDPVTYNNTVQVAGSLMTNLPILNTSEADLLIPGDVVGILTGGPSWTIIGRLIVPGSASAGSSSRSVTNRIQSAFDNSNGTRNSATFGDLTGSGVGPAVTIRIGASGRALVFWSAEIGQTGVLMSDLNPHVGVEVSGANSIAATAQNALNFEFYHGTTADFQAWWQSGTFHTFTGLNPGVTTFTLKYAHQTVVPSTNVNFQAREIAVFAL